ncbi:hypothetical protein DIPPA_11808 [Diplonema papillatum]|nr:hypothetical protein DIPPA_11808 [Diplonema papillatum]
MAVTATGHTKRSSSASYANATSSSRARVGGELKPAPKPAKPAKRNPSRGGKRKQSPDLAATASSDALNVATRKQLTPRVTSAQSELGTATARYAKFVKASAAHTRQGKEPSPYPPLRNKSPRDDGGGGSSARDSQYRSATPTATPTAAAAAAAAVGGVTAHKLDIRRRLDRRSDQRSVSADVDDEKRDFKATPRLSKAISSGKLRSPAKADLSAALAAASSSTSPAPRRRSIGTNALFQAACSVLPGARTGHTSPVLSPPVPPALTGKPLPAATPPASPETHHTQTGGKVHGKPAPTFKPEAALFEANPPRQRSSSPVEHARGRVVGPAAANQQRSPDPPQPPAPRSAVGRRAGQQPAVNLARVESSGNVSSTATPTTTAASTPRSPPDAAADGTPLAQQMQHPRGSPAAMHAVAVTSPPPPPLLATTITTPTTTTTPPTTATPLTAIAAATAGSLSPMGSRPTLHFTAPLSRHVLPSGSMTGGHAPPARPAAAAAAAKPLSSNAHSHAANPVLRTRALSFPSKPGGGATHADPHGRTGSNGREVGEGCGSPVQSVQSPVSTHLGSPMPWKVFNVSSDLNDERRALDDDSDDVDSEECQDEDSDTPQQVVELQGEQDLLGPSEDDNSDASSDPSSPGMIDLEPDPFGSTLSRKRSGQCAHHAPPPSITINDSPRPAAPPAVDANGGLYQLKLLSGLRVNRKPGATERELKKDDDHLPVHDHEHSATPSGSAGAAADVQPPVWFLGARSAGRQGGDAAEEVGQGRRTETETDSDNFGCDRTEDEDTSAAALSPRVTGGSFAGTGDMSNTSPDYPYPSLLTARSNETTDQPCSTEDESLPLPSAAPVHVPAAGARSPRRKVSAARRKHGAGVSCPTPRQLLTKYPLLQDALAAFDAQLQRKRKFPKGFVFEDTMFYRLQGAYQPSKRRKKDRKKPRGSGSKKGHGHSPGPASLPSGLALLSSAGPFGALFAASNARTGFTFSAAGTDMSQPSPRTPKSPRLARGNLFSKPTTATYQCLLELDGKR